MLKDELSSILTGPVSTDPTLCQKFSHDASIFELTPVAVVWPKNPTDIKRIVKFVKGSPELGLSVTARSAGTDMTGGSLTRGIVLEMTKYFDQTLEIGQDFAVTEPGVYYRNFEKETLSKGLLLPSFPASREICTVGGMVANNSGGELSLTYGKTENYVRALRVVLSDGEEYQLGPLTKKELKKKLAQKDFEGEVYRKIFRLVDSNYDLIKKAKPNVSKNSAGYNLWDVWDRETFDLSKLIVGSQGTLGVVTEIKFGLITPKKYRQMMVIFLKNLDPLVEIINRILPFKPESFESYDDHTLKLATKYFLEIIKIIHAGNALHLAWQFLPELRMVLSGGFPKLVLLAEFSADSQAEAHRQAEMALASLDGLPVKSRLTSSPEEAAKYWTIRRESFNLLRHHIKDKKATPFIDDLVVRPENLAQFLPKLNEILSHYNLTYTIAGHVGDGNFHIIPLMNLADPGAKQIIPELEKKVYDLVFQFHGSMTGEHNDGMIRSPFLKQMYGEKVYNLFVEVKKIFDPTGVFNPGKKIGVNLAESLQHFNLGQQ